MTWKTFFVDSCTSTMDVAKTKEAQGEGGIFFVAAAQQTTGRGRQGSTWLQATTSPSPALLQEKNPQGKNPLSTAPPLQHPSLVAAMAGAPDVLPFTLCIPAEQLQVPLGWVPALVGVALVEALEEARLRFASLLPGAPSRSGEEGPVFRLKWPNDVVFENALGLWKVAGVLCESTVSGSEPKTVFVGVGLNFLNAPADVPQASSAVAAAFADSTGRTRNKGEQLLAKDPGLRSMLLHDFVERLERELSELLLVPRGPAQIRDLVVSRSLPLGTVLTVNKGEHRGEFAGLAEDGGLLLAHLDKPIHAGAVDVLNLNPVLSEKETKSLPGKSALPEGKAVHREGIPHNRESKTSHRILALEIGNSRLHYGLRLRGEPIAECGDLALKNLDEEHARLKVSLAPLLRDLREERQATLIIRLASVRSSLETTRTLEQLEGFLKVIFPEIRIRREFVSSAEILKDIPLQGAYPLDQLGSDRALRFRLAWERAKTLNLPVAWASAGTAFTLEAVSPQGDILESWIAPGLKMALDALHQGTSKLPLVPLTELGAETETGTRLSLLNGVVAQALGALTHAFQKHSLAELHLTGGDAAVILEAAMHDVHARRLNLIHATHDELRALLDLKIDATLHNEMPLRGISRLGGSLQSKQGRQPADAYTTPGGSETDAAPEPSAEHAARIIRSMRRGRLTPRAEPLEPPNRDDFRRLGPRIEDNNGAGERLDGFLAHKFLFHARSEWRERIINHEVLVQHGAGKEPVNTLPDNALPVKHDAKLRLYDQLWLYQPAHHEPEQMTNLEIVGDDGDLVAFSKPPNLVIHAAGLYGQNTFIAAAKQLGYGDAAPVHRIDRETSGLLLCGRTPQGRDAVSKAFREGLMKKMYVAVCKGSRHLPTQFDVKLPIGPALGSRIRLKLWVDHPEAAPAHTRFEILARQGEHVLLACVPKTGRTNQIRVHLAAIGMPIVGDKMYHPNEDVFLSFYDEGLTSAVLEHAVWARHLLHNTVLQGPQGSPTLVNTPLVCPVAPDFYDFPPAKNLLEAAGLVNDRSVQIALLGPLFERLHGEVPAQEIPSIAVEQSDFLQTPAPQER